MAARVATRSIGVRRPPRGRRGGRNPKRWGRPVGSRQWHVSVNLLLAGLLVVVPTAASVAYATGTHTAARPGLDGFDRTPVRSPAALPESNFSGYAVWVSGLPPNVSAPLLFGQFGPSGGWYSSGNVRDGFDFGGSPLFPGRYTMIAGAAPGYIPDPASATFFTSGTGLLNVSVRFVPDGGCFLMFTEIGLPVGTEWWVVGNSGLAFFANGSIVDASGCGGVGGLSIGDQAAYTVVELPRGFYPNGAGVPVVFGLPRYGPEFPTEWVSLAAVLTGVVAAAVFGLGPGSGSLGSKGRESNPPRREDPEKSGSVEGTSRAREPGLDSRS